MEERESMLMGEGKKATALWDISSTSHVMARSRAVMNRGMMQREVL